MLTSSEAIQRYNAALKNATEVLRDADPRPGKMTKEQDAAQCSLVSAWLDVEETQGFSFEDEVGMGG